MSTGNATLLALVRKCWSDALAAPHDESGKWAESGGNSLASLHLIHALEIVLDRKLSFDLIDPEMTAADLAAALERKVDVAGADVPTVCLVTGLFGDTPGLAAFRRAFGGRIHFEVVRLPDLDAPAAVLGDLPATGMSVAREIARLRPDGAIMLAGFSFGGLVAYEAAQQLTSMGRSIALVAILDSYFPSTLQVSPESRERFLTRDYWLSMKPARDLIVGISPVDPLRHATIAGVQRFAPRFMEDIRYKLLRHFRVRAMDRWTPAPIAAPVQLAISEHLEPLMLQTWMSLCTQLRVVRVHGGHHDMFSPPQLAVLVPALEAAARNGL